ncbi:hypothetical protein FRC09_004415 [Ceratobasidium sp. 395]|nr:hypothetical protein FRC09_004415 [Ceratobasidium sp. 395]
MGKDTAVSTCRYCGWSGKSAPAVERHIGRKPACAAERAKERKHCVAANFRDCYALDDAAMAILDSQQAGPSTVAPPSPRPPSPRPPSPRPPSPRRSPSVTLEEIEDEDLHRHNRNGSPRLNPNAILEDVEMLDAPPLRRSPSVEIEEIDDEDMPRYHNDPPRRNPNAILEEVDDPDLPEIPLWGPHPFAKPTRASLFSVPHPDPTAGAALHFYEVDREPPPKYMSVLAEPDVFREAHWLDQLPISHADEAAYFSLPRARQWHWKNIKEFEQEINRLPRGPPWFRETIRVIGDQDVEILDLWKRDIVAMIRYLLADPRFIPHTRYAPERHYDDGTRQNRVYDEMWSARWWWQMQNILGRYATIVPIILSTDKTKLTVFSGNQKAWPVYLTIGNISRKIRRCPSERATLLVGYIPVMNLSNISNTQERSEAGWQLFHACMEEILEPLKTLSRTGIDILCADAPDLLHQLDKGVFGDHIIKWTTAILSSNEMDRRTKGMPRFQKLRHFAKGISVISQWTGKEAKALGCTFVALVSGHEKPNLVKAVRSIADFLARAHKHEISESDLRAMDRDVFDFNSAKSVFVQPPRRKKSKLVANERGFNRIAKTHMLTHYPYLIRQLGAPEGFNTEITERLHIDYVKKPWATTNHVNATQQMIAHLGTQEAWALLSAYMHDAGLVLDPRFKDATADDDVEDDDGPEDLLGGADGREDVVWQPSPTVQIAKRPSLGLKVKGAYLINKHKATDLIPATIEYLKSVAPARTAFPITHNTVFKVWRRCKLQHRRLPFDPALEPQTDQVRAFTPSTDVEGRVLRPGFFDTILFSPGTSNNNRRGLQQLEVGRVRAIFELPDHHQSLCSEKLAYIERFRPFAARPSTSTSLYITQHASRGGHRRAIVVPLSQLCMTCHLAPRYNLLNSNYPVSSSSDLLSAHSFFSLNKYVSAWLFSVFDYWEKQRRLNCE